MKTTENDQWLSTRKKPGFYIRATKIHGDGEKFSFFATATGFSINEKRSVFRCCSNNLQQTVDEKRATKHLSGWMMSIFFPL